MQFKRYFIGEGWFEMQENSENPQKVQSSDSESIQWRLTEIRPLGVFTVENKNRPFVVATISINSKDVPDHTIRQMYYQSTGYNSGSPGVWFPFLTIMQSGYIRKGYIDPISGMPRSIENGSIKSRWGHWVHKAISNEISERLSSFDWRNVQQYTSPNDEYDDRLGSVIRPFIQLGTER